MKNRKFNKAITLIYITCISIVFFYSCKEENSTDKPDVSNDTKQYSQRVREWIDILKSDEITITSDVTRGVIFTDTIHSVDPLRIDVPFDYNSAEIIESAKDPLDDLGKTLQSKELTGIKVELGGHTDERGDPNYNLQLSQQRVESVKKYLIENFNISEDRLITRGYGSTKPIHKNATTEIEHASNRRVEVKKLNNNPKDSQMEPDGNNSNIERGSLEFGILRLRNDKMELVKFDGSSILKSGDSYRMYLHPNFKCYVYVYQIDSKGKGNWLFPNDKIRTKNPLNVTDYWLPSRNDFFRLDNTTGTECIYLVASKKPSRDLEECMKNPETIKSEEVSIKIQTRGIAEIKTGPNPNSGEEQSVTIIESKTKKKKENKEGKKPETGKDVVEKIGRTEGFFVKLTFKHE